MKTAVRTTKVGTPKLLMLRVCVCQSELLANMYVHRRVTATALV